MLFCGDGTKKELFVSLERRGLCPIFIPSSSFLSPEVASHPDMLFFAFKNRLFTGRCYFEENRYFFEKAGLSSYLTIIDTDARSPYPYDIPFDVFYLGSTLFCKEKYTPAEIKTNFDRIVNVSQGYAACSSLVLPDTAVITSDRGIFDAVINEGHDALLISSGDVTLPGYDSGFIGGASFVSGKTVFFTGDITRHADGEKIITFISSYGYEIVNLSEENLFDCGSFKEVNINVR